MPIRKTTVLLLQWIVFLNSIILSGSTNGQSQVKINSLSIGLGINGYAGDLHPRMEMWQMGYQLGASVRHLDKLDGTMVIGTGVIAGQNILFPKEPVVGVFPANFFRSHYFLFQYQLQYTFLKIRNLVIYGAAGPALLFFKTYNSEGNPLSSEYQTRLEGESYRNSSLCITMGPGIAYRLPNHYMISVHPTYILPFNDYIDNISELKNSKNLDQLLQFRLEFHVPLSEVIKK